MGVLIRILILLAPRVALVVVGMTSEYLKSAYHNMLWPIAGFFFLPVTTLAYAWAKNTHKTVEGFYLGVVIAAVVIDLTLLGASNPKSRYSGGTGLFAGRGRMRV